MGLRLRLGKLVFDLFTVIYRVILSSMPLNIMELQAYAQMAGGTSVLGGI